MLLKHPAYCVRTLSNRRNQNASHCLVLFAGSHPTFYSHNPTATNIQAELTVSDEQDGGEGDSNNETLNHVQLEEHIVTTDFSHYTTSIKCLTGSHFTRL